MLHSGLPGEPSSAEIASAADENLGTLAVADATHAVQQDRDSSNGGNLEQSAVGTYAKARLTEPPVAVAPPGTSKVFICDDAGTVSCDLVKRIFRDWAWEENTDVQSKRCDLKWTFRSRDSDNVPLDSRQIVNHFRRSCQLSNKAMLGQCLQRCKACSVEFFPRQYDLRGSGGLRDFLRDYITLAADLVVKGGSAAKGDDGVFASQAAARVLRRRLAWEQSGDLAQPERLLRCIHECAAVLGPGCHLPSKQRIAYKARVDVFLGAAESSPSSCSICCADKEVSSAEDIERHEILEHQSTLDGDMNAWALKEPCVQRGAGVTVTSGLSQLLEIYFKQDSYGQGKDCVVQKYIERPLLIKRPWGLSKADLRVWVLVLDWNPLTAFVHPDVYFRVATKPFNYNSGAGSSAGLDPNAHKTNCRDDENRTPLRVVLEAAGPQGAKSWNCKTWPKLLDAVRAALLAACDAMSGDREELAAGPNMFELFGLDFAIDDSWNPWLLEMNTSPSMLEDIEGEYKEELQDWVREATESLLRIALANHDGSLKLPTVTELQKWPAENAELFQRLFPVDGSNSEDSGHTDMCMGSFVAKVPACLVPGLEIGAPCGRWRLILREKRIQQERLRKNNEELMRRQAQARSAVGQPNAMKMLLEWILPMPSRPAAEMSNKSGKYPSSPSRAVVPHEPHRRQSRSVPARAVSLPMVGQRIVSSKRRIHAR